MISSIVQTNKKEMLTEFGHFSGTKCNMPALLFQCSRKIGWLTHEPRKISPASRQCAFGSFALLSFYLSVSQSGVAEQISKSNLRLQIWKLKMTRKILFKTGFKGISIL